jgi:hypothetical protein
VPRLQGDQDVSRLPGICRALQDLLLKFELVLLDEGRDVESRPSSFPLGYWTAGLLRTGGSTGSRDALVLDFRAPGQPRKNPLPNHSGGGPSHRLKSCPV